MRLANKVAVVTGSSQGIGRAIAVRFAEEGADVVICGIADDELSQESVQLVRNAGRRSALFVGDISRVETCAELISFSVAQMGRLDILVNNAGVEKSADFWDITEAHYERTIGVNLKGTFFASQYFVKHLRDAGHGGKIINTSSVHEEIPFPHFATYCASKGGIKMLMRNLAVELAPLGITVNNIAPGAIETPINTKLLNNPELLAALMKNIPLGRLGQPGDVAGAAAFLASADADYITGSTIYVDGGLTWNYTEQ